MPSDDLASSKPVAGGPGEPGTSSNAPSPAAVTLRPSRRRGWLAGITVIVAAVIAAIVVLLLVPFGGTTTYQIAAPASAAGWHRDAAYGPPRLSPAQLRGSQIQKVLDDKAVSGVSAVYTSPVGGQQVIFTGATGQFGNPAQLIAKLRAHPAAVSQAGVATVTWNRVDPGPHGGDAACGEYVSKELLLPVRLAVCAWQTTGSFGELVEFPASGSALNPNAPHLSQSTLAGLMRRMRQDLERT